MAETLPLDPVWNEPLQKHANLEAFLIFCVCVAGKTARVTEPKVRAFLKDIRHGKKVSPFTGLARTIWAGNLVTTMKRYGLGKYKLLERCFTELSHIRTPSLKHISLKKLESIPGIGPKTARFFLMRTRPNQRYAILDTHVLAWLRECGYDAPKSTPQSGKQYHKWEEIYLGICEDLNEDPNELDIAIWEDRHREVA